MNIIEFLTIKNNKIEILRKGKNGTPIIILTGMGCSFDEWYDVIEPLSKSNRVIMFNRPGLGESEIRNEVRNTQAVVNEINELMLLLEILGPVLLVGHSYGGLCAQHFVKEHPKKVAGIVLVDSTSVDLKVLDELDTPVLNEGSTDEIWVEKCASYSLMNQEALREIIINPTLSKKQKKLPFDVQQRLINFQINPSLYKAMHSEINNWKKDADTIKNLGEFPNVPLIVIGRDKEHNIRLGIEDGLPESELRLFEEKWQELIMNQVNLSQNSKLILAQEAGHSIHIDRPDIIIESINWMVKENSFFNERVLYFKKE
ncbi:Pimeloyl-ACP methyl ester carboxylesterase [Paenisporosarcina quisquiliarum]|nr:Pimeloyl-ACP methyl ester carboxylesterase [Paenisporosarcina quisquiliarum]